MTSQLLHSRGLKRKLAFAAFDYKRASAVERMRREIEVERQRKERLEWYLNEVLKEKEALLRGEEPAGLEPIATVDISAPTGFPSLRSSSSSSSSTGSSLVAPQHEPTCTTSNVADSSCERCGYNYYYDANSKKTCRCRNFESVKKRQRCLSRFVRTGQMAEASCVPIDPWAANYTAFECHCGPADSTMTEAAGTTAESLSTSDEDFLRAILDEAFAEAIGNSNYHHVTSVSTERRFSHHRKRHEPAAALEENANGTFPTAVFGY